MITLGIETSCDETSCSVLKGLHEIKSNVVSSSLFRHKPFGGVVPEIAARHCLEQVDFVYKEALRQARVQSRDLDLIAVTQGPGLIGSLIVGVAFAKALSLELGIPILGVNHLEAHLVANFIGQKAPLRYIGLLVSGGHTSLSYHRNGKIEMLGSTVDDAVGEAYDKTAKILGLGYPGGPILDRLAREGNPHAFRFTKPKQKNLFDFSFSGIKTAVLYEVHKQVGAPYSNRPGHNVDMKKKNPAPGSKRKLSRKFQRDMAASFQEAVVRWISEKSLGAAGLKQVQNIVVGGGVSANSRLREVLSSEGASRGLKIWFPPLSLTNDNAAMIARRGAELYRNGKRRQSSLCGNPNLSMG